MLNIWALNRLLFQGLWKTHITLKYKDEYDQRGPHGKDFKGSFTSKSLDSQPRCSLVIYVILFVKCKSLYKFPIMFFFFSSDMLMFFCIFRGGFCCPFNHPSTSLFFFSFPIYLQVQKNSTSHLCYPAEMTILLSAVDPVKFKPQTKLSFRGRWAQKHDGQ